MLIYLGEACKLKFRRKLKPLGSVANALREYDLPLSGLQHNCTQTDQVTVQNVSLQTTAFETSEQTLSQFTFFFEKLSSDKQIDILDDLFALCCRGHFPAPSGYIRNSIVAMKHLRSRRKSNLLAGAARAFGMMRPDNSDSLFPVDRMPFGLLEYSINFFNAKTVNEVSIMKYVFASKL